MKIVSKSEADIIKKFLRMRRRLWLEYIVGVEDREIDGSMKLDTKTLELMRRSFISGIWACISEEYGLYKEDKEND